MRSSSCMSWNNGRQSLRRTTLKDIGHNRILRKSSIKRIQCRRCGCARREGKGLASRAGQHGLSLAKAVGAKVTALTVEGSFDVYTVPASRVYEMSGAFAEHAARAKAHAEKILNGVAEEARSAGVICETVQIEEDHPYEAII